MINTQTYIPDVLLPVIILYLVATHNISTLQWPECSREQKSPTIFSSCSQTPLNTALQLKAFRCDGSFIQQIFPLLLLGSSSARFNQLLTPQLAKLW